MGQRLRWTALLAAMLILAGCATTGVNRGDFNLISLEEEWELGRKLEADIAREMTLVNDQASVAYLNRVGQAIVARTEMASLPWRFHIVADPNINAFNIPGGHVYVNVGLITAARTLSELAGVLAHEITHGVARHGTEQLSKAYGFNVLTGLVLGENPAVYQQILAQVVAGGSFARFSRSAEREADRLGVRWMHEAGYDPAGMASMFEVLLSNRQRAPSRVERFFASHPLTEDRIRAVRAEARTLPARSGLVRDDPEYQALRRRLTGSGR